MTTMQHNKQDDTVTISRKDFNDLMKAEAELRALEFGGVDNWEWYGESFQQFDESIIQFDQDGNVYSVNVFGDRVE